MNGGNLQLLKEEVENVFGRKILTASDCSGLSDDVFRQTKSRVSLNTLRRFFNLMQSKYSPSLFTLDLLAKYCGFGSFSEFTHYKRGVHTANNEQNAVLLNFLTMLLRDVEVKGLDDLTYYNLIRELVKNLQQWPQMIDAFQAQIAKTHNGQLYYYEQFVNIDQLNGCFGDGLRYYLLEKKHPQGQVHGHALLAMRYWLTGRPDALAVHAAEVSGYDVAQLDDAFVCGRFFATRLYGAEAAGRDLDPEVSQARDFYNEFHTRRSVQYSFPCFEYVLAEALVLTGQYEEAGFYIAEAIKKRNNHIPPHIDLRILESIYLYQAVVMAKLGKVQRSKDILETVDIKNFSFLSRKFNGILYLTQKLEFQRGFALQRQLAHLIAQTGFTRMVAQVPQPELEVSGAATSLVVGKNGQTKVSVGG